MSTSPFYLLSSDKPYYNVACLLVAAAGCSSECFVRFFSYDEKWRDFARWFWSNEVKRDLLLKISKAQNFDLLEWYWRNQ